MQFIPLQEIKGKNRSAVIKFLLKHEAYCVQLAAVLKKNVSDGYAVFVDEICESDLYGIISVRKTILHLLPFMKSGVETALQSDFCKSFVEFYKKEGFAAPVCINGLEDGTKILLDCFRQLKKEPGQVNEYNLMKLDAKEFLMNLRKAVPGIRGSSIIRCKRDSEETISTQLVNMQEEYEKEEVIPDCYEFDEASCRLRFMNSLRNQYIFALKNDFGKVVSKAGTNSIAYKHIQLGGVYTLPDFRGQKYSSYLLKYLLVKLIRMRKSVTLFVKIQNKPANKLYNSLSFKKIGSYSIAYFT